MSSIGHQAASVRFKVLVVNPDGTEILAQDWKNNLLLNTGLDNVALAHWVDNFGYGVAGTSTNPTRRDSTPTTFTVSGGVITASAGFFVAADVGRILKTNDPSFTEMTITGYTSGTSVTTSSGATIGTGYTGTVWYVNDTSLGAEVKRTNTYTTSTGDNGSTFSVDTWTHQRTYLFSAETGSVTYNELGWAPAASGNLFGRATIAGTTLVAGQQLKVVITLTVKYSPASPTAVADVSGATFSTAGTASIDKNSEVYGVDASGNPTPLGNGMLEPLAAKTCALASATFAQSSMATSGASPTFTDSVALAKAAYVAGSFTQSLSGTFTVSQGNYTIYGYFILGYGNQTVFSVKLTTPIAKTNTHTLTPTFTYSWGRILTN